MIIIIGLIILVAAVIAGAAGILGNGGSGHAVTHFSVLGYHVTGSTGTLFLYGIAVGVIGLFGLWLLLAGARRTSRRGRAARRGLRQSRRETAASRQETAAVSKDRDELIGQRDTARAYTASTLGDSAPSGNGAPPAGHNPSQDDDRRGRPRLFGRRAASRQPVTAPAQALAGQPATDVPAGTLISAPDVPAGAPAPDIPAEAPAHAE
jgi:hypothetical protein